MFLGKHSRALFIIVTVTFLVASVFAVGRVIGRFGIVKRHGWDDYVFIAAWILAFGLSFTVGFGTSMDFGDGDGDTTRLRTQYTAMVMFIPALMTAKISILLLYLDIARQSQKFLRVGSYITLAIVLVGSVILAFMTALRCRPVEAAYNFAARDHRCIPIQNIWLSAWPINIATELAILVLPIPALATLPLTPWRKSMVILSFILGAILIGVIDVARIYNLQLAVIDLEQATAPRPVNVGMALLWSAVEVNTAVIGAAIPTLPPVIRRLTPFNALRLTFHGSTRTLRQLFSPQAGSQNSPSPNALEHHSNRAGSLSTPPIPPEQDTVYFGFINLEQPKCIVDMRGSECVKYCAIINLLLFLNGFIYNMLFSINTSIPIVKTRTQAVGMVSACYVGAGILSPTIGYAILRCVGLKATIATSLAISCVGTLIFWPCGAVGSYPGFVIGNIMVGASLGIMEIVASTFNSLCGPPSYGTARILIGTGLEAVGGTLSSVLATKILAIHVEDTHNLVALQWAYLIIALFTVLLGLLYWYVPLPHVMDPELRTRSGILTVDTSEKHLGVVPVIVVSLGVAALSSFCAAGALASLRTSIGSILSIVHLRRWSIPIRLLESLHPPRVILLSACGTGITLAAVISSDVFPSAAMVQQVTLALSILLGGIPSMVVAIALQGLGWWSALACGLLISSCSLGAGICPWVMLAVSTNKSAQYAYCIVVALFAVGGVFPLYLSLVRSARGRERPPGWGFIGAVFQRRSRRVQV
ncbi:L-fucose-proton symporter [Fusarium oxysporum f. sp. raphani]|uniref:L-fucose-proton symporter n=1 Tax=Fusarium oxysporum f. sp. raphani TaxID=96318 RepID=A0A8J5NKT4_FUSOX|nr:L-fucose-proton symporter [Fusarium oxysporum f. sp. raphani]